MKRTLARAKLWLISDRDEPIIGEGKAAFLKSINEEGSLNKACKKTGISYKHAWILLKEIEKKMGEPVVIKNAEVKARGHS